jgi:hypothetical protein
MTPIQQSTTHPDWMSLEGTTLDGAYVLGQCLEADERRIVFKARVKAGQPPTAIVKFYRAISNGAGAADEQLALWQAIKDLKHSNLLTILGAGRAKLQSEELLYVVVEPADEVLNKVLEQRPLDADEAGELLLSMCRGLEHLHAAGFVHGSLSPEEVFGVGDSVKISTDGARRAGSSGIAFKSVKYRAPESVNGNMTAENDVWCLGATLFEALTQKECGAECRSEAANLPVPFATIVHRCLYNNPEARCTLPEIVQLYERRPRAFSAAAGAGAGAALDVGNSRERGGSSSVAPEPLQSEAAKVLPIEGPKKQIRYFFPGSVSTRPRTQRRTWVILAIVLIVIAALIWVARPRKSKQRGAMPTTAATQVSPQPQVAAPARNTTQNTASPATNQVPRAPKAAAAMSSARTRPARGERRGTQETQYVNGPIWRVVIYTYDAAADAQKRAQLINEKHSDLKADVFSPKGNGGPYLVVIGGQMDRDSAAALRQKALRLGLPRDTYIQNWPF